MRALVNLGISQRLWLVVALPALLVVVCIAAIDRVYIEAASTMEKVSTGVALATEISSMVHELQRERGLSAGFAASRGAKLVAERRDQLIRSNAALSTLETALPSTASATAISPPLAEQVNKVRNALGKIGGFRTKVDRHEVGAPEVIAFYTGVITDMLGTVDVLAATRGDEAVGNQLLAYLNLMYAKEAAGIERATGSAALGSGSVSTAAARRLAALAAEQDVRFGQYRAFADPTQKAALDAVQGSVEVETVTGLRARFTAESGLGDLTAEGWFAATTKRIDTLKGLEDTVAAHLKDTTARAAGNARTMLYLVTGGGSVCLLFGAVIITWLARSITGPTVRLTRAMLDLAEGNLQVDIPGAERVYDIGAMARSVEVFRAQAIAVRRLEAERARSEERAEEGRRLALEQMADTVERETATVVTHVGEESASVARTAHEMARSASRVERNAQSVAAAAAQSLANAETVAGATEELAASIHEIGAQVARSTTMVGGAVDAATAAQSTIDNLAKAMVRIDEVVSVIADIAAQTNLLALNASIESARAGEAGRGFAVVANEVKRLANQTADQTQDISDQIASLKAMTDEVARAILGTAGAIQAVQDTSSNIAAAVEQQNAATAEISRNVTQAADSARTVTARIADVAREAQATGGQAASVEDLLKRMSAKVDELGHVLTKIVRTTSPEVNRRGEDRLISNSPAVLRLANGEVKVVVRDVSSRGALLELQDAVEVILGQTATLTAPGLDEPMPVAIVATEGSAVRVRMRDHKLDPAAFAG
ncbi:MAG: nitrate- and nitrite sensing domain-containing protein [Magnetospirillum sp.]|nr:nitrate- and nitrite sensing domain-containing protein [Magnetospirillum sp.]